MTKKTNKSSSNRANKNTKTNKTKKNSNDTVPEISQKRIDKFNIKRDKTRVKLELKLKKLEQKTASEYNLFLQVLFAVERFFRDKIWCKISRRAKDFLSRRPHRSFYLTSRINSRRNFKLRGYFDFASDVWSLIWKNKWIFTKFLLLYSVLSAIIVGLMSQANFANLRDMVDQAQITGINRWWTLFSGAVSGGLGGRSTGMGQQITTILLFLYGWLTLVWLLRRIINGDTPKLKLRDGLYSGGSPVMSTLCILLYIILQLLPLLLVFLVYSSITAVGWINTGIQIENMAAWCALAITVVLTLYWVSGSFIALIIATLPGMYPFQAIKAAGDLVVGRRVRLVLRLVFMMLPIVIMWILILLPAVMIDNWLQLTWQPLVPIIILILTTLTIIWCATYIYMLYRQLVDDPAPPVLEHKIEQSKKKSKKQANKSAKSKKSANIIISPIKKFQKLFQRKQK